MLSFDTFYALCRYFYNSMTVGSSLEDVVKVHEEEFSIAVYRLYDDFVFDSAATVNSVFEYCKRLENNLISADGHKNSFVHFNSDGTAIGGSSGGGSINIFYLSEDSVFGNQSVIGGSATCGLGNAKAYGGAGGDGTCTIQRLQRNYTLVSDNKQIKAYDTEGWKLL